MTTHGARAPARELEVSAFLSRHHHTAAHHLSASECETLPMGALLALADAEDAARWAALDLAYTDPTGAPWLRDTVAGTYATLAPSDVACFAGAQEGLYAVLHTLLQPGDHAVVVVPGYQSTETLAMGLADCTGVTLDAGDAWSLDPDAVAAAFRPNTRLLMLSFPNNPTGAVLPPERLAALVTLCRRHGAWLLSDEAYRGTERDPADRLPHAADAYERGVSVSALSKAHGLPGLRVGWVACRDAALLRRVGAFRQYLSVCSPGPSEVLASIALKAGPTLLGRTRAIADANLSVLQPFLARHASLFDWTPPRAGVVGYVRYAGPDGVEAFVARMAHEAGVLLLPASVFRSELASLPADRFRIGFGGHGFEAGLRALEAAL